MTILGRRLSGGQCIAGLLALAAIVLPSAALAGGLPVTSIEAGAYFDYVAPDPTGPTDGSIRLGYTVTVETITADAVLVPPADTNLPFFTGGTPTCLSVTRDGGVITRLEFVAECTVSGAVVIADDLFGPGADAYLIGDQLAAPAALVEGDPAFGALIGAPAAAGTTLDVAVHVDVSVGAPTSFDGQTTVSGPAVELNSGDFMVGAARLPSAVIDVASRSALQAAAALGVDATVAITGHGVIQLEGDPTMDVTLAVTYVAPTPTPTPTIVPTPTPAPTAGELPDTGAPLSPPPTGPSPWLAVLLGCAMTFVGGRLVLRTGHGHR